MKKSDMTDLSDDQCAAIERLEAQLEALPPQEHAKRMRAALSVSRQEVDESLAKKEKEKKGKKDRLLSSNPSSPNPSS